MVTYEDFKKMDLRIVQIKDAKEHPNADKLLVIRFDVDDDVDGEERQVVAGIKNFYKPEELIGKKVVAITNVETANIRGVESAGMILAASDGDTLTLLTPQKDIKTGTKIS